MGGGGAGGGLPTALYLIVLLINGDKLIINKTVDCCKYI